MRFQEIIDYEQLILQLRNQMRDKTLYLQQMIKKYKSQTRVLVISSGKFNPVSLITLPLGILAI